MSRVILKEINWKFNVRHYMFLPGTVPIVAQNNPEAGFAGVMPREGRKARRFPYFFHTKNAAQDVLDPSQHIIP
jgi:hypothetical protein